MTGCITVTEYVYPEYELPAEPNREVLAIPETTEDLGIIINYYDGLVSEWEIWAEKIKEIIIIDK
jgi:hypothetical protein